MIIGMIIAFNSCATNGSSNDAERIERLLVDNPSLTLKDYPEFVLMIPEAK